MSRDYSNYYEDMVRTARALRPSLTKDEFLSMILRYTLEDCACMGDTANEQQNLVEHTKRRLGEAWDKSLTLKYSN